VFLVPGGGPVADHDQPSWLLVVVVMVGPYGGPDADHDHDQPLWLLLVAELESAELQARREVQALNPLPVVRVHGNGCGL
jgi:hypothetical protein